MNHTKGVPVTILVRILAPQGTIAEKQMQLPVCTDVQKGTHLVKELLSIDVYFTLLNLYLQFRVGYGFLPVWKNGNANPF